MNPGPGLVVLVRFPFSDLTSTKQRPALLLHYVELSSVIQLYLVSMITSRVDSPTTVGDVLLKDWKEAGLLYPSKLRLTKTATLDHALIQKTLGKLTERDLTTTRKAFQEFFRFWI